MSDHERVCSLRRHVTMQHLYCSLWVTCHALMQHLYMTCHAAHDALHMRTWHAMLLNMMHTNDAHDAIEWVACCESEAHTVEHIYIYICAVSVPFPSRPFAWIELAVSGSIHMLLHLFDSEDQLESVRLSLLVSRSDDTVHASVVSSMFYVGTSLWPNSAGNQNRVKV